MNDVVRRLIFRNNNIFVLNSGQIFNNIRIFEYICLCVFMCFYSIELESLTSHL